MSVLWLYMREGVFDSAGTRLRSHLLFAAQTPKLVIAITDKNKTAWNRVWVQKLL